MLQRVTVPHSGCVVPVDHSCPAFHAPKLTTSIRGMQHIQPAASLGLPLACHTWTPHGPTLSSFTLH